MGHTPTLVGILSEDIEGFWPHAAPHLEKIKSLDTSHAKALCASGAWQLWLVVKGQDCIAAVITEMTEEPSRVVTIVNAAGRDFRQWTKIAVDEVKAWAKSKGASKVRVIGREGWSRQLKNEDFKKTAVILEAEI